MGTKESERQKRARKKKGRGRRAKACKQVAAQKAGGWMRRRGSEGGKERGDEGGDEGGLAGGGEGAGEAMELVAILDPLSVFLGRQAAGVGPHRRCFFIFAAANKKGTGKRRQTRL